MADNKQYITQTEKNGKVMISEDVIVTVIAQAASEVEGLAALSTKSGADIMDILAAKNWGKGIKVELDADSVKIDCFVCVSYGQSVVAVARNAQDAIANAVESMTGVKVAEVNVNVCGIVRK